MKYEKILFLVLVLSSCTWDEPLTVGSVTIDYSSDKSIYDIDFNGKSAVEITVNSVQAKDVFVVQSNASSSLRPSSYGYISSGRSSEFAEHRIVSQSNDNGDYILRRDYPGVVKTRTLFTSLNNTSASRSISAPSASVTPVVYNEGDSKSFAIDYTDAYGNMKFYDVNATLKRKSNTAYIWVAENNELSEHPNKDKFENFKTSAINNDNAVNQTQIDRLAEIMSGTVDASGTVTKMGIYERVSNLIGYEKGGGPLVAGIPSGDGGIDGHQRIHILVYDIQGDQTINQTNGVLGYFWPKDEYTNLEIQASSNPADRAIVSNEMEIFYLDTHFLDNEPPLMYSTLAHEYQHMIHFNQKQLSSPIWFNEMCSMLIEDFLYNYLQIEVDAHEDDSPVYRIAAYLDNYYLSGVLDWQNDIINYASAFTFGAFLTRNYGNAKMLEELMLNKTETGITAINEALSRLAYSDTFDDVFRKYVSAHVFDVENAAKGEYTMNVPYTAPADSFYADYPQVQLSLIQRNNGYPGEKGPAWETLDSAIFLRPYGVFLQSADQLQNAGTSNVHFKLYAPGDDVKVQIMIRDTIY